MPTQQALSSEQRAKAQRLLDLLKQYKAKQTRENSMANITPVYTPPAESSGVDVGGLMSGSGAVATELGDFANNPLEGIRRLGAGAIRGMTFGLVNPDKPLLSDLPDMIGGAKESKAKELAASQKAMKSAPAIVGEFAGSIAPFAVVQKGVGAIRVLKTLSEAEGVAAPLLGSFVRGGASGGAVGVLNQLGRVAQGGEFDIKDAGRTAAEFAVLDAALFGLGKAGSKIRSLLQERRFADAERLYKESLAAQGVMEMNPQDIKQAGIAVGSRVKDIGAGKNVSDVIGYKTGGTTGRLSGTGEDMLVSSGMALDNIPVKTDLPYRFASLGPEGKPVLTAKDVFGGQPNPPAKATIGSGEGTIINDTRPIIGDMIRSTETNAQIRALYHNIEPWQTSGTRTVSLGSLGINPDDLIDLGRNTATGIEKAGGWITPAILKQAKNRVKLPESKQLFSEILSADNMKGRIVGTNVEALNQLGLYKMGEADAFKLADALEQSEMIGTSPFRSILKSLHDMARSSGIEIGYINKYYPRVLKYDVADQLYNDLSGLLKKLEGTGNASDIAISKALEKASGETRDILTHLVKTGQAKNLHEAVNLANREAARHLFPKSSFEKARNLELPGSVYDRDARRVLTKYVNDLGKRIAEAKTWGPNGESAIATLDKIRNADIDEGKIAEKVLQMWSGQYEQLYGLKGEAKKWADRMMGFEFGTKIGAGTATIPNITQPAISTIPSLGVWNFVKGAFKNLSSDARSFIRSSGALNNQSIHAAMGYRPGGLMGKFADKLAKISGFDSINKLNLYTSASTFETAARGWWKTAQKNGLRSNWAKKRLADFGVDASKPLSEEKLLEGMYRFATDSQLQRNVLNDQIILNDPKWRPFFIFKRFGMRQATYIKDMVWRELKRGNVMPVLRLAAGGMLGGEFVVWSKNKIKSVLSGEPAYRDEEFTSWERVVNNIAAVGTFGIVSDVAAVTKISEIPGALKFAVTPVILNDVLQVLDNVTQFTKDWEKYGDVWLATKRNDGAVFDVIGSLPRYVSKQLDTKQQKRDRIEREKGLKKEEIYNGIISGDVQEAKNKLILWNKNHPENPFTADDLSADTILKYMKRKVKTKADVSR